ncbi:UNVERIFIED_CONTAM: hypothetical protein FKN15_025933 [Acipenser sinensis]
MGCIKNCWDQADQRGGYSCPSAQRPLPQDLFCFGTPCWLNLWRILRRHDSILLLQLLLLRAVLDLEMCRVIFCTGRKFKAVNSCLTCLTSYCETHVKPHLEVAAFKRHKLIQAAGNLEQKICDEHQKVLEVFCRTDQTCICVLCIDKEHKSHDTVSAEAGRQRSSQRFFQESEKIFTQLIRSIEKIRSEVTELIGAQEKATVNQAEGIMKKLEQEIAELRRRNAELKQLSETKGHIHFLQAEQLEPEQSKLQETGKIHSFNADSFICDSYINPSPTPLNLPVAVRPRQTLSAEHLGTAVKSLWVIRIWLQLSPPVCHLSVPFRQTEVSIRCIGVQCEATGI